MNKRLSTHTYYSVTVRYKVSMDCSTNPINNNSTVDPSQLKAFVVIVQLIQLILKICVILIFVIQRNPWLLAVIIRLRIQILIVLLLPD